MASGIPTRVSLNHGTPATQPEALRPGEAPSHRPARALEPAGSLAVLAGARGPRAPSLQETSAPARSARAVLPAIQDAQDADALRQAPAALLALNQLPAHERSTLMKPFAEILNRAKTPEKLYAAALQLFEVRGLASPVKAEVLTLIANRVDRMPPAEHLDVLDALTAETLMTLSKADMQVPLQAMARQLKLYPMDRRFNMVTLFACQNEFGHMVGTSKDACLDPPQRAQVLVTLAGEVKSMAEDGPKTWGYLLERAVTLPAEYRRPVLDALGRQCDAFLPSVRQLAERSLATEKAKCPP